MQDGDIFSLFVLFMAIGLISVVAWAVPVRLWIEALSAGTRVGMGYLVGMRLRKVSPPAVVRPLIWATKAGIPLSVNDLEPRAPTSRAGPAPSSRPPRAPPPPRSAPPCRLRNAARSTRPRLGP